MNKLGFLSLEFIAGDQTYWLESGDKDFSAAFGFRVIPRAVFEGQILLDNHLIKERDYSGMTVFGDDNGATAITFTPSTKTDQVPYHIDLKLYPKLSWNMAFWALTKTDIPLVDLTGFWHKQLCERNEGAPDWVKPGLRYLVTAWLPNETEPLFCVMGEDYKLPENPNMVTVQCENRAAFLERLSWFKVTAMRFVANQEEFWPV